MALKCILHAKLQLSATEIQCELGPVDIADTWLANNDFSHLGEFGIGLEFILICKLHLRWNDFKLFFAEFLTFILIEWLVSRAWKQIWHGYACCGWINGRILGSASHRLADLVAVGHPNRLHSESRASGSGAIFRGQALTRRTGFFLG